MNNPVTPDRLRTPIYSPLHVVDVGELAGGQDARLCWGRYWDGASLNLRSGLSEREELAAVRWAVDTLVYRRLDLGEPAGAVDWRAGDPPPAVSPAERPAGAELVVAATRLAGLLELWAARPSASEPAPEHRRAGAEAVLELDDLIRWPHRTRATLLTELRAHDDAHTAAVDALPAARTERTTHPRA